MLEFATGIGFYSLIELLLERENWTQDELGASLCHAARDQREDLISLLLANDAPWECAEADEIIASMDEALIRRFIALGMRFDTHDAFFTALDCKRARPLLRIYKVFRPEHPELEDQIAKVLVSSIKAKRLRWSILLLWAGADPNRPVPYDLGGPVDEDTYTTTALEEAYGHGDIEFLEQLKIESKGVNLGQLLDRFTYNAKPEVIARIISRMPPDELNSAEGNSCNALESLVRAEHYKHRGDYSWMSSKEQEQRDQLESIALLINSGARWDPQQDNLRGTRRGLSSYDGKYIVQVLRLLIYTAGTSPFKKVWELCQTPKMKHLIYGTDDHLWREMNEMALEQGLKGTTKKRSRNRASL